MVRSVPLLLSALVLRLFSPSCILNYFTLVSPSAGILKGNSFCIIIGIWCLIKERLNPWFPLPSPLSPFFCSSMAWLQKWQLSLSHYSSILYENWLVVVLLYHQHNLQVEQAGCSLFAFFDVDTAYITHTPDDAVHPHFCFYSRLFWDGLLLSVTR